MAYSISLSVTQNSQSVANNSSNVTVKVNCSWTYGTWSAENLSKWVKINGTTYYFSDTDINPNKTTSGSNTLYTKTLDIPHNADGTKTLSVSASVKTTNSSGTQTASKSVKLDTIARASTVSATSAVVGAQSTITISRKSSSFTHTLEYSLGSATGTIATKTSNTSVKWTLPTTFYAQIGASATSKGGTITCKTYNGSTLVGTKTTSFTAKTSSATCAPTLSPTVTADANTQALTGDTTTLIRYYSTANVTFGASARNSATLSNKSVANSGKSRTTDGAFSNVTSGSFVFAATDSRGYTTSKTINNAFINYIKPTCNINVSISVSGAATVVVKGNFFNGSFGAQANNLNIQYRYKVHGGSYSDWINPSSAGSSGNTYTASETLTGLDYSKVYYFQARTIDRINTATTSEVRIKSNPVYDWGESDFNFNVPVSITNSGVVYNLLGAAKALTTTYDLPCSVALGGNYSSGTAQAHLIGSCLRLGISATRSAATTVGNITNEEIMSITVTHNKKITNLYRVDFNNGTEGGVVTLDAQVSKVDDNNLKIVVRLCATTIATTTLNAYTVMPAGLNLTAFV